jgi:hypothetical protein
VSAPVFVFAVVDCRDKISSINATRDLAQSKVDRFNADPFIEPGTPDPGAPYAVVAAPANLPLSRPHEAAAIAAYLRICDAGNAGRYITARYPGECAVTHATIKPYMQIVSIGDGAFARRDAVSAISIRGNESIDDILARFGWASPDLAAEWIAAGSTVLLFTAATLKPKVIRPTRSMGSVTLDEVTALYWRSVAFMIRRDS